MTHNRIQVVTLGYNLRQAVRFTQMRLSINSRPFLGLGIDGKGLLKQEPD